MKILVTGATGFIGRYVVGELEKTDCRVIATSLEENTELFATCEKVKYIPCDLRRRDGGFYELFERPDVVVHLAWGGLPNYDELFHIEENLPTSYFFLKEMIASGCRNVNVAGTCFEYGLQEGRLDETMPARPNTCYGLAKNTLRLFLEELQKRHDFDLKWIRLFYMYGEGQSKKSVLEQLKTALENGDETFNMSGGEQLRDYLPVETVAENIAKISMQTAVTGIVNNCSGTPISIRRLVEQYIEKSGKNITLNLGHYPYANYEPHAFWGNADKLHQIKKSFEHTIKPTGKYIMPEFNQLSHEWMVSSMNSKYSYNFTWMGRPIIQYPQDMIAMQEIVWNVRPDLIIETGIAHGGSLIYYASLLELLGGDGHVLGIDIDIREHNRVEIEKHPMFKRITMFEGSSIAPETARRVREFTKPYQTILLVLDSNHTHDHVLQELKLYAPLVAKGSYCVVFDTVVEDMPAGSFSDRPWDKGNNPKTAVWEFLKTAGDFEIDREIQDKLLITVAPDGYLKKVK